MKHRSGIHRNGGLLLVVIAVLLGVVTPTVAQEIDQQAVREAIKKGQEYLWSAREKKTWNDVEEAKERLKTAEKKFEIDPRDRGTTFTPDVWGPYNDYGDKHYYPAGYTVLAAYALMESGVSPLDSRLQKALEWLEDVDSHMTYSLGLRANVWHVADRTTKGKYLRNLKVDAARLIRSTKKGAYRYECWGRRKSDAKKFDNSNAQYGVLGVWAAAQSGLPVPSQYWKLVMQHWLATQAPDGGWAYQSPKGVYREIKKKGHNAVSNFEMTAAGLATMFVCVDNLYGREFINCRKDSDIPPIEKGLKWFDKYFPESIEKFDGYYLYGLERVGLASGYKYFGKIDWYKQGVKLVLEAQRKKDGSWKGGKGGRIGATSFALLFLARGQNPVIFNKLEFDGDWNNRPRDLAMLCRWISKELEQTYNWQIINLKVPVSEFHDAPFLYISGAEKPSFSEKDLDKLRRYVYEGGTLLTVTECRGPYFRKEMREVYKKLFPEYELKEVPRDHPIYSQHYKTRGRPELYMVTNGVRPLAIHTDDDLSRDWQLQASATRKNSFEIMANLLLYQVGAGQLDDLRPRGTTHWPKPLTKKETSALKHKVKMAIVTLDDQKLIEPLAYERFATLMGRRQKVDVTFAKPKKSKDAYGTPTISIGELPDSGAKVAVLMGRGEFSLDLSQKAAIKKYVANGGTLLIEAIGGDRTFSTAAERQLQQMFDIRMLDRLSVDSKFYRRKGLEISEVSYRPPTVKRIGRQKSPRLETVEVDDRPAVLVSREDISSALLGAPAGMIDGYDSESAWRLMRNIVLESADIPVEKK